MKDTTSIKVVGFWFAMIMVIVAFSLIPPEKIPQEKWVPRSETSGSEKARMKYEQGNSQYRQGKDLPQGDGSYDWESDKKQETNRWQDFLEDCDNMGISPTDPDAQELWSEKY